MPELNKVSIVGNGSCVPDKVLDNAYFEKIVDTSDEWITTRTGIKERRAVEPDVVTSDLATKSALKALESAKIQAEELDLIIVGTVTPDHPFPSTACYVQKNIGAINAPAFDISAACSGFMYSLTVGYRMVSTGSYKNVLIIGADILTKITDYTDRASCVLFGDGAGAVVLQPNNQGHEVIYTYMGADGTGADVMVQPAGGSRNPASHKTVDERLHYMRLRGREIYKFAVMKMADLVADAAKQCNITVADIALIVPHQVNQRILEAAAERLNISMDKIFVNIHKYGNTAAASAAIAFDEAARSGRLKKGDYVVLVAFGGGLTWGVTVLKW
ncbi:MAG: ketoacyl-ACP synthase III [Planctomycetes bacterium]|nr:ketoacyl-ACP synthase III [Planctomycetota bacterium]